MTVELLKKNNDEFFTYSPIDNFSMTERLDEELDYGKCYVKSKTKEAIAEGELVFIQISDDKVSKIIPFLGFDDVEKRAEDLYLHTIELVEPTRLLLEIPIDGLKITQPIDETTKKKTLLDVLTKVLKCYHTQRRTLSNGEYLDIELNEMKIDSHTAYILSHVVSPEFEWQEGTLLFEVLQDIADVVNAIPRLTANISDPSFYVVFNMVNEIAGEYEL